MTKSISQLKPEKPLGVGLFLPNEEEHLALITELIDKDADFFELSPEVLWLGSSSGGKIDNHPSLDLFLQIRDFIQKPFVAHGLALSLGTPLTTSNERHRTTAWLEKMAEMHQLFNFQYYTEHLGFTNSSDGHFAILPLPLPYNDEAVNTVAERLNLMQEIVPLVGFENSVFYFTMGNPMDEAEFYNRICAKAQSGMLLDLHNVYSHCLNFDLDPYEFLDRIELDNVIQIHLSGGSESETDWLPSKKVMRLDSHDDDIPEEVIDLFKYVLPKCDNLRGVLVERLNGTLDENNIDRFKAEFRMVKSIYAEYFLKAEIQHS